MSVNNVVGIRQASQVSQRTRSWSQTKEKVKLLKSVLSCFEKVWWFLKKLNIELTIPEYMPKRTENKYPHNSNMNIIAALFIINKKQK